MLTIARVRAWIAEQQRFNREFRDIWRELKRAPWTPGGGEAQAPYVGTLTNEQIDADDWTRTFDEPEHPPKDTW